MTIQSIRTLVSLVAYRDDECPIISHLNDVDLWRQPGLFGHAVEDGIGLPQQMAGTGELDDATSVQHHDLRKERLIIVSRDTERPSVSPLKSP